MPDKKHDLTRISQISSGYISSQMYRMYDPENAVRAVETSTPSTAEGLKTKVRKRVSVKASREAMLQQFVDESIE